MKRKLAFTALLIVGTFSFGSINTFANMPVDWEYKSVEDIDRMDGRTYLVSHCEDKPGDDCTTPGSATRIEIPNP